MDDNPFYPNSTNFNTRPRVEWFFKIASIEHNPSIFLFIYFSLDSNTSFSAPFPFFFSYNPNISRLYFTNELPNFIYLLSFERRKNASVQIFTIFFSPLSSMELVFFSRVFFFAFVRATKYTRGRIGRRSMKNR